MTIWHRRTLFLPFLVAILGIVSGCGYRLGPPEASVGTVSYSFHAESLIAPEVESIIRQASWAEVHRRVDIGAGCQLEVILTGASYSPSLGRVSRVELSLRARLGEGNIVERVGRRSFAVNSPEEADEMRLISYGTLATSLVSEIVLQVLTNGDEQCP